MFKNYSLLAYLMIASAVIGFSAIGLSASSVAEQPLGQFGVWEAFTEREGKSRLCFMASEATKARGNYKKRGKTYVMVTHRPTDKSTNVVSVEAGYSYKKDSEAQIIIGKKIFKLFTSGTTAFAYDAKADSAIVKAMVRGAVMTVKGISLRRTPTTDTYSLKGFTASYKSISAACKV
tara:strand:+ start:401 stop:931 length:531 start_codon:yes stop_codon:yes gene_type:complete